MTEIIGWDIGGAHLKLARTRGGAVLDVRQIPCPLWQGMDRLAEAMDQGLTGWPAPDVHAATMTGELVDLFPNRANGVGCLLTAVGERAASGTLAIYAVDGGFLTMQEAIAEPD